MPTYYGNIFGGFCLKGSPRWEAAKKNRENRLRNKHRR